MNDDRDEDKSGFKVRDRRRFSPNGQPRTEPTEEDAAGKPAAGAPRPLPEIDFSTFIISLSSSVMMHLGVDPQTGECTKSKDLDLARQTIDILGILREKTQGNLSEDEARLLEELLYNLRMAFVRYCP